ncbi:uncharacterized protein BDZ83DRAFT_583691 [Colletotrichum acutatum]|uniref:Myb-like domain-containing protein n=1 Tax=Glomerella acutata TaxID=27357 RepID=A0AAD8XCF3_GLOAC|nr:uncharacterized protein BDZ83DRAFT_583691 [Colletotrichum acutatum]KAK1721371.1 hypothetical protein BDZ83DRAFT_583691 [Colletotrichum acutatum]
MFKVAAPWGFHGSDILAFEQEMKVRAQQRSNIRRQRKLFARNTHKNSFSFRSTQQPGAMSSEDWSLAVIPEGTQDSFEAQQLRNRYLAGTAGSPYADPDHGIFFARIQRLDGSLNGRRQVMDQSQTWQPFGVTDTTDVQSMFAPMPYQYDVSSIDGIPMSTSNTLCHGISTSSPVFTASDPGTSFGSFSSAGAPPTLLDSSSFNSTDGSVIITSPSDQFEYANSPFASSSMVPEDFNGIKAAPQSPPPFSEPNSILFFPTPQEQLLEHQQQMESQQAAISSHASFRGVKAEPPAQQVLMSRPRKELPEKPRSSRVDNSTSSSSRRRASPTRKPVPSTHKTELRPKQPKPCPAQASTLDLAERSAKDEYLLKAKQEGLTYREIRVKGNFSEAESTLRGRYRTLTKSKEARVRKPEWTDKDVHLLQRAVRKFAKGSDPASTKIPWKQVAEYIQRNGGSYLFGNATCRKKWDELVMVASGHQIGAYGAMA